MISVFDYSDYRKFIKEYQQIKSGMNSAFSFRYLAKKAGINSSSFYPQVINGNRNLTKKTILKTCTALNLKDKEAEYFENLVFFNHAKTIKEKNFFFDKLVENQKLKNVKKIEAGQYDYFAMWYHCIIREAAVILDWKNDYTLLAKYLNPPITTLQAKESVALLLKLGFLKVVDKKYFQVEPLLTSESDVDFKVHSLTTFQIQMLHMAIDAYDRWKSQKRLTSATTFSFSEKNYAKYVEILRECRLQLMKLTMSDDQPDQVYMLSMNFFPMTHTKS